MRFLGPQISLGASKSPNIWNFSAKSKIAQNGLSFWESDLLKFLGPFVAKLELSAPKNECFRALFGQKKIERKKYSSKLKFSSSVMPTMFPRLVQHQLNPSTQQHLGNVSCISPEWLKSWPLIIDSHFWLLKRHKFLKNLKSDRVKYYKMGENLHKINFSRQFG